MEGTRDDIKDEGSGGEECGGGGGGHGGALSERSPWGRGGEVRGGREASVSPSTSGTGRYLTRIWWRGGELYFRFGKIREEML